MQNENSGSEDGERRSAFRSIPVLPAIPEKGDASKILQENTILKRKTAASQSRFGIENAVARGRYQNAPLTASSDVGSKIDQKEKLITMVK